MPHKTKSHLGRNKETKKFRHLCVSFAIAHSFKVKDYNRTPIHHMTFQLYAAVRDKRMHCTKGPAAEVKGHLMRMRKRR